MYSKTSMWLDKNTQLRDYDRTISEHNYFNIFHYFNNFDAELRIDFSLEGQVIPLAVLNLVAPLFPDVA